MATKIKLTPFQRDILSLLAQQPGFGLQVQGYDYKYYVKGEEGQSIHVTGVILALRKKGFVSTIHFSGSKAGVNITESGRRVIA